LTTIWFGNAEKYQYVKAMLSELPSGSVNWNQVVQKQRGTASVFSSRASHKVFDLSWSGTAEETAVFGDYQAGLYGTGKIYFVLPAAKRTNLFSPQWAAPRLIEVEASGWTEIYDTTATFSATTTNVYSQPPRSATYTTAATVPNQRYTIPIAPTETLSLGWTGSATGSGAVYYRVLKADGTYATPVALTAIAATSSTRMNATIAGNASTAVAVEVYLYGAGTVTVTSLQAQLWPTGATVTNTGSFQPGRGFRGLEFLGALDQSIIQDTGDRQQYSVNGTLVETES
jgi:hypothetical protein